MCIGIMFTLYLFSLGDNNLCHGVYCEIYYYQSRNNRYLKLLCHIRHFSLLNVNVAGACGYDFRCDGGRLVRAYLRQ